MSQAPWWSAHLPAGLRQRLEGRPLVRAILGNTGWLFADRLLRMALGMLVGVWVARYLGPARYGALNYAANMAGTFAILAALDMDSVLVRELALRPGHEQALLGTAFRLRAFAGLPALALAVGTTWALRPQEPQLAVMTGLFGVAIFSQSPDVIEAWFRSRLKAQWVVIARGSAYVVVALLRVGLILSGAGVVAFAGAAAAEALLASAALWVVFLRKGGPSGHWAWDAQRAKAMLALAWPLLLSSLAVIGYMKIDQFMLAAMVGDAEVGRYAAAVRLSELWYFMPMALASSAAPALAEAQRDPAIFEQRWIKLFRAMLYMSLPVALLMTLLAEPLCQLLYGASFEGTGAILALHIWAAVFVFIGVAQGAGEVARGQTRQMMIRTWSGALLNVALNLVWIPRWQGMGAAAATVVSYAVANSVALSFSAAGRRDLRVQGRALLSALGRPA